MDSRATKEVLVSIPYVKVASKATPRVAVKPGIAPKIIPNRTAPKRINTLMGLAIK